MADESLALVAVPEPVAGPAGEGGVRVLPGAEADVPADEVLALDPHGRAGGFAIWLVDRAAAVHGAVGVALAHGAGPAVGLLLVGLAAPQLLGPLADRVQLRLGRSHDLLGLLLGPGVQDLRGLLRGLARGLRLLLSAPELLVRRLPGLVAQPLLGLEVRRLGLLQLLGFLQLPPQVVHLLRYVSHRLLRLAAGLVGAGHRVPVLQLRRLDLLLLRVLRGHARLLHGLLGAF
mmetsp:Transcript_87849/g.284383  ORF Transcript_87849/g.284383 Transcript_87849/m.284383 type:complete len:232 (+) Transcript_87849:145-840(+)